MVASWELEGTVFECEDEHHLTLMATHLNNVIRGYEGLPVTFYLHRIREKYHDVFDSNSGIPFSDEVTRLYYQPIRENRSGVTGCFHPLLRALLSAGEKAMKAQPSGKRKAALDDALKVMLEYREALASALSRYTATPLGMYEENRRVYSAQLSLYHRLLTGQWQRWRSRVHRFMKH